MSSIIEVDTVIDDIGVSLTQYLEQNNIEDPAVIGIRSGGVWVAEQLHQKIQSPAPLGELDISFYRDDFTRVGLNPKVKPSSLPFETEGRNIILVDDVVMSGRTIRAAMNEIFDYGRPARILLVALVDVGRRELPIQPDIVGKSLSLPDSEQVKLVKDAEGQLSLLQKIVAV